MVGTTLLAGRVVPKLYLTLPRPWRIPPIGGRQSKPDDRPMFMGEFEHTVDDKGRLAIPAKIRGKFADGLVVTRGLDGCLFVYTPTGWASLAGKIASLPLSQRNARSFQRIMFSGATDCQLDQQGRFVLPAFLRSYAAIGNEVVIIGVSTRLEIWAKERWQETKARVEEESDSIAEQLADLGI